MGVDRGNAATPSGRGFGKIHIHHILHISHITSIIHTDTHRHTWEWIERATPFWRGFGKIHIHYILYILHVTSIRPRMINATFIFEPRIKFLSISKSRLKNAKKTRKPLFLSELGLLPNQPCGSCVVYPPTAVYTKTHRHTWEWIEGDALWAKI